jgi:hypothetical protein
VSVDGEQTMIEIRKTITLRETVSRNSASKQIGQSRALWEWR